MHLLLLFVCSTGKAVADSCRNIQVDEKGRALYASAVILRH
jgi:hypothetical protein